MTNFNYILIGFSNAGKTRFCDSIAYLRDKTITPLSVSTTLNFNIYNFNLKEIEGDNELFFQNNSNQGLDFVSASVRDPSGQKIREEINGISATLNKSNGLIYIINGEDVNIEGIKELDQVINIKCAESSLIKKPHTSVVITKTQTPKTLINYDNILNKDYRSLDEQGITDFVKNNNAALFIVDSVGPRNDKYNPDPSCLYVKAYEEYLENPLQTNLCSPFSLTALLEQLITDDSLISDELFDTIEPYCLGW